MSKNILIISAFVMLLGVFAMMALIQEQDEAVQMEQAKQAEERAPAAEPTPLIRFPVAQEQETITEEAVEPEAEPAFMIRQRLPDLNDSDGSVLEVLDLITDRNRLVSLFQGKKIINRVVTTVDNIGGDNLPIKQQLHMPLKESFPVRHDAQGKMYIDEKNAERYLPYITFLESLDIKKLVTVYVHFYPLFQQAYEELGFPGRYFNDRMIFAIDHLLETPDINDPIELKQPSVQYTFADPALEKLSAGQKALIRMGSDNATRIKVLLINLRVELLSRVTHSRS